MSTSHAAAMGFFHGIAQACRRAWGGQSEATETGHGHGHALYAMALSMWSYPHILLAVHPRIVRLHWNNEREYWCPKGCSRSAPFWLVWYKPRTGKITKALDIFDAEQLQRVMDKYGLDVHLMDVKNLPNAMFFALTECPDDRAVQLLLDAGADVKIRRDEPPFGRRPTVLHVAKSSSRVDQLVRAGANVNARDDHCGDTPLHIAAAVGHVSLVSALLAAGADANAVNEHGATPLHHVRGVEQAKALLAAGAQVPDTLDAFAQVHVDRARLEMLIAQELQPRAELLAAAPAPAARPRRRA